jgi:hypothetical protein
VLRSIRWRLYLLVAAGRAELDGIRGLREGGVRQAASCRISSSARSGRWCPGAGSRAGRLLAQHRTYATFFAAGQSNPGRDSQPKSGPRKITRNLILDFAIIVWTGHLPLLTTRFVSDLDRPFCDS